MSPLDRLRQLGLVGPLDVRFGEAMARLALVSDPDVVLGAALACRAMSVGDVGVDLARIGSSLAMRTDEDLPSLPDAAWWRGRLLGAPAIVRQPHEDRTTPLILDGDDLYLERTWAYQERLATTVRARLNAPARSVDLDRLHALTARLKFDAPQSALQLRAVITAAHRGFALIAGGPGTGKTAVVVKLLAVLQQLESERTGEALRVKLAAPTGKAAARMSESIRQRVLAWIPEDLRSAVQAVEASTVHRLLGWRGGTRFQHHADNPLAVDLLIVDEASMVDLPLMTKMLEAVPPHARVLLLGDPDQLASVEVGSVFSDLVEATSGPVSEPLARAWRHLGCDRPSRPHSGDRPQPGDALTVLTHTWRYAVDSGIEALAAAINAGDASRAVEVLRGDDFGDVELLDLPAASTPDALESLVLDAYVRVGRAASPTEALQALRSVRVLGAHRAGLLGVTELNARLDDRVRQRLGVAPELDWYAGRPVMVTRNDHELRLYNGDVGVVLGGSDSPDALQVWFETADGSGRAIGSALLPEHDTVFATTVHKSQGSEYAHVVLVLPTTASAVVTRELLYTAVTRASARVTVIGSAEVLGAAVRRKTTRMSRLGVRVAGG